MKNGVRVIFHIDLNQFFCSCAILKNPRLKGKAFAIGRENTMKGVISTASYEARKYGVNSGMSLVEAFKKLPSLIVVSYPYELYHEYSKKFFNLLHEYVKDIEQTSVDEGYLDVTDITLNVNKHPLDLAKEIQQRAINELGLPCSIGIAPTLFLAKMASDMKKPLGITVLRKRDVKTKLYPLSVKDIFGIGKKTWPKLINKGINTIADFMDPNNDELVRSVVSDKTIKHVRESINGNTTDVVDPNRYGDPESVSHSETFDTPLTTYEETITNVLRLAEAAYVEMVREGKLAKTVNITLRNTKFKTITRAKSLEKPSMDKSILFYYIEDLVEDNYQSEPLRLVGAGFSNLTDKDEVIKEEITLFNYQDYYGKEEAIQKLLEKYKGKIYFGKDIENKKGK